ncbi:MAG: ABC transporter ATP-binding protein [Lactococcus raffinolactis]|jgi:ABC-2 type transport system ATP-binding protein|uniref:ATP-binding cassette domain-containing protein n=1 Tax=Pseudolactococcus raffinolactis TaxID=1366 RepID=A0A2A5S845_9LACT|nr:ABC transporter ATP-binding protein [Lactococcus raffinolactis]MBP6301373.1 ABC transporter ATP-binding protein [Lactococcus sp.]ATC61324.1 ABC transporter ATP-binding protein [Lactococcus raffinolactis]MBP6984363.1 ABC transporter ATP-binding protein [Lactococcus sp.]MBR2541581.1 ABC transporter ATP-binding protein [Lactococcus sp.]MBW9298982.1 ABC transporter ATP-binding protein [Lactococcus raffinolactis]
MQLALKNINKSFDDKQLFNDVTFNFETGKIYGLLGRNGAGKTTLFNCIAQNLSVDSGSIAIIDDAGQENTAYENTEIGFVTTTTHLPDFMTGLEFVHFVMDLNRERLTTPYSARENLTRYGINDSDQNKLLRDYSHGMQNKVQMLVTEVTNTPIYLLDEPLTSFDPVAAYEVKERIRELKSQAIVIFSTHILELAKELCDEIVLLHDQKLEVLGNDKLQSQDFEKEIVTILSEEHGNDTLS